MRCNVCGNDYAAAIRTIVENDACVDVGCDRCQGVNPQIADAYLPRLGMTFENLCDSMGKPYEIRSKSHKKEIMDRLGVSEAGNTVNGARFGTQTWVDGTRAYRKRQFEKDRPMIRENLKRWKETGYASNKH